MINGVRAGFLTQNQYKSIDKKLNKPDLPEVSNNGAISAFYVPVSFCGASNSELNKTKEEIRQNIADALDSKNFELTTPDGVKVEGTILDYIKNCIIRIKENDACTNLLHGTSAEARKKILEEGFDSNKISRTVCGPGTCFAGSEYEAHMIGGGAIISCSYEGNTALMQHGYFDKIVYNPEIVKIVADEAGISLSKQTYSLANMAKKLKLIN